VVIIGVIGETISDFGTFPDSKAGREQKDLIGKLSSIILILGLALELFAAARTNQLSDEVIGDLESQSSHTLTALGSAIERASGADERAGIAERKAGEANERASKNEREAAALRRQAAGLTKTAEDERLARAKIEEKLAGWNLDADSQKRLWETLTPFRGTPFDLLSDPSEARFTGEINDVLIASGWTRLEPLDPKGKPYTVFVGVAGAYVGTPGINIEVARDSFGRFGEAFSALSKGLAAVGIPAKTNIVRAGEGDPRAIHIIVGKR
jgi:hypothetical protein